MVPMVSSSAAPDATNYGAIGGFGVASTEEGVTLAAGGAVINGAATDRTASIVGGDGVVTNGAAGTIHNLGYSPPRTKGSAARLEGGGAVVNGAAGYIGGYYGIVGGTFSPGHQLRNHPDRRRGDHWPPRRGGDQWRLR